MGRFDSNYESWETHNNRITAEKAKAEAEKLCPEEVNDWARYTQTTKHKICLRPLSPEAVQMGHNVCGMHLRGLRKAESEGARLAAQRAQAKIEQARREKLEKVKDDQQEAIEKLLLKRGFEGLDLSRAYGWGSRKRPWQVTIPLSVAFKLIDELPMLDPDEAVEAFKQREQAAAEAGAAKQVNQGPAPF